MGYRKRWGGGEGGQCGAGKDGEEEKEAEEE